MTLIIVIISISFCALFAGIEIGCFSVNKVRLRYRISKKHQNAKLLSNNLKDPQIFVFTMLIFQNVFNYISSLVVTHYYINANVAGEGLTFLYNFIPWSAEIAATLTLLLPLFIFAEISPKNLFRIKADVLMYKTARLQQFCIFICKPFTLFLKYFSGLLSKSSETGFNYELQNLTSQKLKLIFSESSKEGTITTHQSDMINNTLDIHNISVTKVMVPLNKVISLSVNDSASRYLNILKNNSFNLLPVYSGMRSNIIGIAGFFDVLDGADNKNFDLKPHLAKIISVKWNDNIQQTFYKLQNEKETSALVKNKRGKTIGIIYLRDIVKQITEGA